MPDTEVYSGSLYKYSGTDFAWSATGETRYVVKGTGFTLKDNGTSGPTQSSAADWIVSDDLWDIGVTTASLRIKATKTAGASYTAGTHYCNGFPAISTAELAAYVTTGSGNTALYINSASTPNAGSVQIPTALTSGGNATDTYAYVHFSATSSTHIVTPIRFIAVVLPLQSHASTSPAGHTWEFEAQWFYTR